MTHITQAFRKFWQFIIVLALVSGFAVAGVSGAEIPDSLRLEKELQSLSWPRFRAVVEGIPELRAGVDRYGELGWQYVRANYRTYPWKKNIDKLNPDQKQELATLIRKARGSGAVAPAPTFKASGQAPAYR